MASLNSGGDRLQHEAEQDQHPHPVGSSEAGGVEEGEGGEEGTAKRHQGREGELPFPPCRVHDHFLLRLILPKGEEERLPALNEEQEDQQGSQQGDQEPPILL